MSGVIRALLVAGRRGAPAEGRLPFNPLYFHILRLTAAQGPIRPSQIADALGVSRTTVSTAVKALAKRDLISRDADATDGRAHVLSLTADGREVVEAIERQDRRNAEAMLSGLDPEERAVFVATLEKVAAGLAG